MSTERYVGVKGAAEHLGLKASWIYAHRHELPAIKIGGLLRFRLRDLDEWMASNLQSSSWR